MTERDHLPIQTEDFERLFELISPLKRLCGLRKSLDNSQPEIAEEYRDAISGLMIVFPELASGRDIAIFPDGHMEVAQDVFETHRVLWERRIKFYGENHLSKPESMISGEIFEIGKTKFLRIDQLSFVRLKKRFNSTPFLEKGYMVLGPDFYPIFS